LMCCNRSVAVTEIVGCSHVCLSLFMDTLYTNPDGLYIAILGIGIADLA